jgi:hypothetical protein
MTDKKKKRLNCRTDRPCIDRDYILKSAVDSPDLNFRQYLSEPQSTKVGLGTNDIDLNSITYSFFEGVRKELELILCKDLPYTVFSSDFLGKRSSYISHLYYRLKTDKNFLLNRKKLEEIKDFLLNSLEVKGLAFSPQLDLLFEQYMCFIVDESISIDYISLYFGENIEIFDSKQIIELAENYNIIFENLCINKAKELKNLIINEYGRIQGLEYVPLRSIFSFDFGTKIRKVEKRENVALTMNMLKKVKKEINEYKINQKTLIDANEGSYNKIFTFIDEHLEFSEYIESKKTGRFKISDIKFAYSSNKLELRSWLFENLRYIFPLKLEIPLDNNLLSWFLFNDDPGYSEQSLVNFKLTASELCKRLELRELLAIDYRVSKLTVDHFSFKNISISNSELKNLKLRVSYLIYYYVFFMEHERPYVADSTFSGIKTGKEYWTPEYFVIRSVFFSVAEANQGVIKDFKTIGRESGVNKIQRYLREGYGFGDKYVNLLEYVNELCNNSNNTNTEIFNDSLAFLEQYEEIYFKRIKNRNNLESYDSHFERKVHFFLKNEINPLFVHKVALIEAVGKREIYYENEFGRAIVKKIHPIYHYDFYLELDDNLRQLYNLNNKWKSIAVEAQGSYWHSDNFSDNIKSDEFKKLISRLEDIILIEIWDNVEEELWLSEYNNQLKNYSKS